MRRMVRYGLRSTVLFGVSARVLALPVPGIGTHLTQVPRGLPSEQGGCEGCVGVTCCDVARPAFDDMVGDRFARHRLECSDDLEDAMTFAGPQIYRKKSLLLAQLRKSRQMSRREIHDVDVVAHAGAIRRRVVIPEN